MVHSAMLGVYMSPNYATTPPPRLPPQECRIVGPTVGRGSGLLLGPHGLSHILGEKSETTDFRPSRTSVLSPLGRLKAFKQSDGNFV